MSDKLVIRPADEQDRLATLENTWRHWGDGLTRDEFFENRLNSPQFQRSQRYVGVIGDRVVVSLAAYSCEFQLDGKLLEGTAIGSVYTHDDFRGHGYASQLLEHVDELHTKAGIHLSILYSEIPPAFYERLGYVKCPSWRGKATIAPSTPPPSAGWHLEELDPRQSLAELELLYAEDFTSQPMWIIRSHAYWEFTLDYRKDDRFFWLLSGDKQRAGYVRVAVNKKNELQIVDHALAARRDAVELALYMSLKHLASGESIETIQTWIPNSPPANACFDVQPRHDEITMIKPLDGKIELSPQAIAATELFHEADHV